MKKTRKVALFSLCCVIVVSLVLWLSVFRLIPFENEWRPPIDEGIPVSEMQNFILSNSDLLEPYKIFGGQSEWGHLFFLVIENATSSDSPMRIEFDRERQMTISPWAEPVVGKGLTCLEFWELLEKARNELERFQEFQHGLLYFVFTDEDTVRFVFGWTNYSLSGSGISIWFHKVDGAWKKHGSGPWIS